MCIQVQREHNEEMKHKPKNLTNKTLNLVKNTYNQIIKDNVITDEEMTFLRKLHWMVYDYTEQNNNIIINDLMKLSGWTIKDVSR